MKIKLRADSVEVEGYVNAVGRDSRKMIDDEGFSFREQIQPGAFAKAIKAKEESGEEIPLYLDHDHTRQIGGTGSNLQIEEDNIGLHAVATITDPAVVEKARAGKLCGWSFGFVELDHDDEYTGKGHRVIVTGMDLREITLVDDQAIPAYAGTSVHTRTDGKEERLLTRTMGDAIYVERGDQEKHPDPDLNHEYYELIDSLKTM